jgi:hypothetical protein
MHCRAVVKELLEAVLLLQKAENGCSRGNECGKLLEGFRSGCPSLF